MHALQNVYLLAFTETLDALMDGKSGMRVITCSTVSTSSLRVNSSGFRTLDVFKETFLLLTTL